LLIQHTQVISALHRFYPQPFFEAITFVKQIQDEFIRVKDKVQ